LIEKSEIGNDFSFMSFLSFLSLWRTQEPLKMQKVLIAPMTLATQEGPYQKMLRDAGFELVYPSRPAQLTEDELLRAIQGVKGALAGSEPYTRRIIESNRELRVIARAGVGYDAVDLAAATDCGVGVAITPG